MLTSTATGSQKPLDQTGHVDEGEDGPPVIAREDVRSEPPVAHTVSSDPDLKRDDQGHGTRDREVPIERKPQWKPARANSARRDRGAPPVEETASEAQTIYFAPSDLKTLSNIGHAIKSSGRLKGLVKGHVGVSMAVRTALDLLFEAFEDDEEAVYDRAVRIARRGRIR